MGSITAMTPPRLMPSSNDSPLSCNRSKREVTDGIALGRRSFLALAAGAAASAAGAVPAATLRPLPISRQRQQHGLIPCCLQWRAARDGSGGAGNGRGDPGRPARALTYNGLLPGPLLEVQPGDTVRIRLHNRLARPTNLHYHGLHIPPGGTADNVFLSVAAGASQTYSFTLPADHPAGTFYYHPHRHGTVADQVFGGLGGVLIVRGALDRIPELRAADEQVLFLKDLPGQGGVRPERCGDDAGPRGTCPHRQRPGEPGPDHSRRWPAAAADRERIQCPLLAAGP
jgi:FtsP/CotA-like multicopper oxidase with cupredoxin domain